MNLFVDKMVAANLKLLSEMESASVPSNEHDDNDASGGAFGSHDDIDFNFLHSK